MSKKTDLQLVYDEPQQIARQGLRGDEFVAFTQVAVARIKRDTAIEVARIKYKSRIVFAAATVLTGAFGFGAAFMATHSKETPPPSVHPAPFIHVGTINVNPVPQSSAPIVIPIYPTPTPVAAPAIVNEVDPCECPPPRQLRMVVRNGVRTITNTGEDSGDEEDLTDEQ